MGRERSSRCCRLAEQSRRGRPRNRPRQLIDHPRVDTLRLAASADWLNSLPASPELDRAVISYTFRAAEEDPETAMSWASSIEDDGRRTWMMERVASTWKEQDAETFKNYLDKSELSAEQREKLENSQSRGNGYWGRRRN